MLLKQLGFEYIILITCGCALSCCIYFTTPVSDKQSKTKETAAALPIFPQFVGTGMINTFQQIKTNQHLEIAQNSDSSNYKFSAKTENR